MKQATYYSLKFGQKLYRRVKALMDFIIAILAIVALLPLFLCVAVAIKIDSRGPVFFVQQRIGMNGKLFYCIKFRSMSVDAKHDIATYEYEGCQNYVTKVGAFIRKYSIDELPQLFNVIFFQMSLIGYRPSQANEKELNDARECYNMYQIRPGISGWAQINGRDILASNPKKKAEFDNYYLMNFSFFLDLKIFFCTLIKVFKSSDVNDEIICEKSVDEECTQVESVSDNSPMPEHIK